MAEKTKYFVLKQKAVPEVLLKVVEAKRLLDSGKAVSVQEAAENVGISRSSFYKYKDDIFPFHDNAKGKTITMVIQLDDEPGLLSVVLRIVADYHANILTIHQSIPVNGIASLTLSVDVLNETGDISQMVDTIERATGHSLFKNISKGVTNDDSDCSIRLRYDWFRCGGSIKSKQREYHKTRRKRNIYQVYPGSA
ncbi:MAG: ACT domain-containing protein [Eubacterium ramulus]